MKARHQARLRKFATALAVVLLHVVAIRALLIVRGLLVPSAGEEPASPLTTWVYLRPRRLPQRQAPPPLRALSS